MLRGLAGMTAKAEPSYVTTALERGAECAHYSVRFGLGRENIEAGINFVTGMLSYKVHKFENISNHESVNVD